GPLLAKAGASDVQTEGATPARTACARAPFKTCATSFSCAQYCVQRRQPVQPAKAIAAETSGSSVESDTLPHGVWASRAVASLTGQAKVHIFGQKRHSSGSRLTS